MLNSTQLWYFQSDSAGFEKFVAEVMHQHSDAAALFLSRFPDDMMHVAHFYVLLPIVYRKLCALALVDGVAAMIDETIIAKARLIRQQTQQQQQQQQHIELKKKKSKFHHSVVVSFRSVRLPRQRK
jgi:hypothetical protein